MEKICSTSDPEPAMSVNIAKLHETASADPRTTRSSEKWKRAYDGALRILQHREDTDKIQTISY